MQNCSCSGNNSVHSLESPTPSFLCQFLIRLPSIRLPIIRLPPVSEEFLPGAGTAAHEEEVEDEHGGQGVGEPADFSASASGRAAFSGGDGISTVIPVRSMIVRKIRIPAPSVNCGDSYGPAVTPH